MSERAKEIYALAEGQVTELIQMLSAADEAMLRQPCPGRENLGDGSIAASAKHVAVNYRLITEFVGASDRLSAADRPPGVAGHRIPYRHRIVRQAPPDHGDQRSGGGHSESAFTADKVDARRLPRELSRVRESLASIATLTDRQLDGVPPDGSFKFCDGKRSLEQVLRALLRHQAHQVEAIRTATSPGRA